MPSKHPNDSSKHNNTINPVKPDPPRILRIDGQSSGEWRSSRSEFDDDSQSTSRIKCEPGAERCGKQEDYADNPKAKGIRQIQRIGRH